ncbi:hypothetical protein D9Q98_001242 [Chlorella vulgaris]|uniref:ABC transporter domain-containing protein n=1 Tax=Chlorella vulgaris TaxID=3077 RepID=A0A9D4U098_CHLVU|nr:hypothetical protein D9Q98_001242 [Chlorella vulgaris]
MTQAVAAGCGGSVGLCRQLGRPTAPQSRAQRHRLPQQGPRHAHYQQRAAPVLAAAEAEAAPETAVALPAVEHEQQRGGSNNGTQPSTSGRQADAVPTVRGAKVVVRDMVKHFKTPRGLFKAVNGASVAMEPGTITALLGPSGSGKTTLLRLIAGLEQPNSGRVYFDGEDITEYGVQDRDLGFVFQGYALFKHMTVAQNITFGPRMRKMGLDLDAKVDELLTLTELDGLGGRYPPQLSGGQKQRVAVARALACNPRLMLLDEPFGALDPLVRKSLRNGLREIVKRVGVTTIIVTHDQEEAWDLADHVVIFNKGAIEQEGTPEEVSRAPVSPFVMNFVADVCHIPSTCQLVRKVGFHTDKPYVMLRSADIRLRTDFEECTSCAAATVHDKANMGKLVRYYVRFDDDVDVDLTVSRQVDEERYDFDVGQRVFVDVSPEQMMGFDWHEISTGATDV